MERNIILPWEVSNIIHNDREVSRSHSTKEGIEIYWREGLNLRVKLFLEIVKGIVEKYRKVAENLLREVKSMHSIQRRRTFKPFSMR